MAVYHDRLIYKTLSKALDNKLVKIDASILVVCGGNFDRDVLLDLGFTNVTISNLDTRMKGDEFNPYSWSFQDAENITLEDGAYDWVLVHAGLHHCYSPHSALLEMLRVGKLGAIVFEARESFTMKLAMKYKLTPVYEVQAVIGNGFEYGGVANSFIPNFAYRWTENEVSKVVKCKYPQFSDNKVDFSYSLNIPYSRLDFINSTFKRLFLKALFIPLKLYAFLFPKQSNEFGFIIQKGTTLQPWLQKEEGEVKLNMEYLEANFNAEVRK